MDSAELDHFIGEATALTKTRNTQLTRDFGLGSHARYHLDLEGGTLTFLDGSNTPVLKFRITPVGSLATASQSWLWSWENASIPKDASRAIEPVRLFGAEHDVPALTQAFSPCDESLAWALAAISLKLLDAVGVYRIDQPKTQLFLLLFGPDPMKDKVN